MRYQEPAILVANRVVQGDYRQVDLEAPRIATEAGPGQFVHLQLPALRHRVLRRPFSICDTDVTRGLLSVIYKVVGEGTAHLAQLSPGVAVDLLGPLGVGFSLPPAGTQPVIVAGGYGAAATFLLAKRSAPAPIVLLGGRTAGDLLLQTEFRDLGADVRTSTDDGSAGYHGVVTDLLERLIAQPDVDHGAVRVAACGPNPMLRAVANVLSRHGLDGEVSLDHVMCCGIGACFACVAKLNADTPDGWEYVRTCLSGPVFRASEVIWD